jgi:hypothetical protein
MASGRMSGLVCFNVPSTASALNHTESDTGSTALK